ncbi:MAG: hypothetical protein ACLFUH_05465 [Bacteroidales bacterium]
MKILDANKTRVGISVLVLDNDKRKHLLITKARLVKLFEEAHKGKNAYTV